MQEEIEQQSPHELHHEPSPGVLEAGRAMYFSLDVGDDERVRQWPSFVGMTNGKIIVRLTAYPGAFPDNELK